MKYNSLIEVMRAFSDKSVCEAHLEKLRWNGKPVCPHCSAKNPYKTNRGYKCRNKECHKKFSVTVGTFFENTNIPLSKWFVAMYLITSHKKGISSLQLAKDIEVTQKTAWFILHRIREMLKGNFSELLEGTIEADETFIGGQNKNRHKHKQIDNTQGRSVKDKIPVFGLFQRDGNLIIKPTIDTTRQSIHPIVRENVKQGSRLLTDEWGGYNGLNKTYNHNVVHHSSGQYVTGDVHTNSLEGFWSLLKRGIYGIYHQVSPQHLHRYCDEFSFRYNTRISNEANRLDKAISQCKGRLKYADLISRRVTQTAQQPMQLRLFQ